MKEVFNLNFYKSLYGDLFLPENEEFFIIVHFHGGGLIEGDKGDTHECCRHLANKGFAVFTANYSLYPNARFPEYLIEAAKAVEYIKENISKYGKSKGIIIAGQSAGGYISLMLCFNKEYLEFAGLSNNDIVGFISDAGQTTSHFNILKYEKNLDPWVQRIDETAPLFYVDKNVDFSHTLLLAYEDDLPNRVEQNRLLLSTVKNFNKGLDIEFKLLKSWHCHGSSELDEDGEFEVVKIIEKWGDRL